MLIKELIFKKQPLGARFKSVTIKEFAIRSSVEVGHLSEKPHHFKTKI